MVRTDTLSSYRGKRNLRRSGEPSGSGRRDGRSREPRFVVQHHLATSDHYDFRLEDHPLDYADFEGVIPDGDYGSGPVQVWDIGRYRNRSEDHGAPVPMGQAIDRGHVSFELDGQKLHGGFALTRMRTGRGESWLLVKKKDEHAADRQSQQGRRRSE